MHYVYELDSFTPLARMSVPMDRPEDGQGTTVSLAYYHCDQIGTPQKLTDEAGEVAWSARYRAWGAAQEVINEAARKAGITNPLRFAGQYFDRETGLHYNRHRYYDPNSGRFVSKDPIGLDGGINVFQYAPNPTGWIDPLGLARCPCDPCSKYDVGTYDDLKRRSASGDGLDIHHAMQKHPASQVVVGYDPNTGPAIAVPAGEHEQIPTRKGVYTGTARDLLAGDIRDLRQHTGASNKCLQRLIALNNEMYPKAFKK